MKSFIALLALLALSTTAHANQNDLRVCAETLACCSDDATCDAVMADCLDTAFAEEDELSKARRLIAIARTLQTVANDDTFSCEPVTVTPGGGTNPWDIEQNQI